MSIELVVSIPLFVISIIILIVSLLMSPSANSFSGALVGSSDLELFSSSKESGYKKFLKYSMGILGTMLFIVALVVRLYI